MPARPTALPRADVLCRRARQLHPARHWAHALHSPYWWLKCAFWDNADDNILVKSYHRFLVWDLMDQPWITRTMERLLNPAMGKSVVLYFQKAAA